MQNTEGGNDLLFIIKSLPSFDDANMIVVLRNLFA
jgi:hypothetical protein